MKLISYVRANKPGYGLIAADGVIDASDRLGGRFPTLRAVLEADALSELSGLTIAAADFPLDSVTLAPPIPNPQKILCVGLNYKTHIEEANQPVPQHPIIFFRTPSSLVAHGAPIVRPLESERLDFEGELAVVVGNGGRRIPRDRAYEHVAGYMSFNDGSIRDFQRHGTQWGPGKNFPGTGACGPWLTTRDEVGNLDACELVTSLNGEVMQRAPLSDLLFDVPELLAYISTFTRLEPGDIIVTGTTGGVGGARNPPVWMKPGDTIRVAISGIGELENPVVDERDLAA